MAASFYDLSAAGFLQTVSAMAGFLERAAEHYADSPDLDNLVSERLFFDMAPLHFHVEAACHHSRFGMEAGRPGGFDPPGLRGRVPLPDRSATAAWPGAGPR